MEFSYVRNLGIGHEARYDPLLYVTLVGAREAEIYSLVDSGSPSNLFNIDYAKDVGIDLSDAPEVVISGIYGEQVGHLKTVTLKFMGKVWQSEVVFCERNEAYDLLGGKGFFQHFDVQFKYFERKFIVKPAPALYWEKS